MSLLLLLYGAPVEEDEAPPVPDVETPGGAGGPIGGTSRRRQRPYTNRWPDVVVRPVPRADEDLALALLL